MGESQHQIHSDFALNINLFWYDRCKYKGDYFYSLSGYTYEMITFHFILNYGTLTSCSNQNLLFLHSI